MSDAKFDFSVLISDCIFTILVSFEIYFIVDVASTAANLVAETGKILHLCRVIDMDSRLEGSVRDWLYEKVFELTKKK